MLIAAIRGHSLGTRDVTQIRDVSQIRRNTAARSVSGAYTTLFLFFVQERFAVIDPQTGLLTLLFHIHSRDRGAMGGIQLWLYLCEYVYTAIKYCLVGGIL